MPSLHPLQAASTPGRAALTSRPASLGRDWPAMAFLAAFALLLTSFAARNSDLWRYLAGGREFLQTAAFTRTWLFDVGAFGVYSSLGEVGLVGVKAVLAAILAFLLFRQSLAGGGPACAVLACALALVTIAPRWQVQPSAATLLLLAAVGWLTRPRGPADEQAGEMSRNWALLAVFLAWSQIDGGFVFGLAFLALAWLGRALDKADPTPGRSFVTFALIAGGCLLNPWHARAFEPTAWLPTGPAVSPLAPAWLAEQGLRPASVAFFALLGLGALSFPLNRGAWRWRHLLPWAAFAGVACWNARFAPHFAVAAAGALAWNLQEFFARRAEQVGPRRRRAAEPVLALGLGLALLVAAWTGWLLAPPFEPRRWAVETPPSLTQAAAAVARWHAEGKLPPGARSFHVHPDSAGVFAWRCREDRPLLDPEVAAALRGEESAPDDWADRLRAEGVTHLVVHDPDRGRLGATLSSLATDPDGWPLLLVEGDVAVFGWRAAAPDGFDRLRFDPDQLAYRPEPGKRAPREPAEAEPRRWYEALWRRAPERTADRDEATMYLLQAEAARRTALARHLLAWEATRSAGLVLSPCAASPAGAMLNVRFVLAQLYPADPGKKRGISPLDRHGLSLRRAFLLSQDDSPPSLILLAIRAARRAAAADPGDATPHLVLGECYIRLLRTTRERVWASTYRELPQLRQAQALLALNEAVRLRPDLAQAHGHLSELYRQSGCLDLALDHLRAFDRLTGSVSDVAELAAEVRQREASLASEAANARVLDRAQTAERLGLGGKARDTLLGSDVAAFGSRGMALQLELMLRTGRHRDAMAWMEPEQLPALGSSTYRWLRARGRAGLGDYAGAELELTELARSLVPDEAGGRQMSARELASALVGQAVLDEQPGLAFFPHLLTRARGRSEFQSRINSLVRGVREQGNLATLRGLLALEEGEIDDAVTAFRAALRQWGSAEAAASGAGLDFQGREAARSWLWRLE